MTDTAAPPRTVTGKYAALYDFVARRVGARQAGYLAGSPRDSAALARLRRAVGSSPGADPEIWADTLNGMPHRYVGGDQRITAAEQSVHATLCLYAVHQQGRGEPMHVRDVSFGRAASRLALRTGNDDAVTRRFQALATAIDLPETLHHARGLITQFRGEGIPLDYARFAVDLTRLQHPASADRVRLTWGRDYYFISNTTESAADESADDLATPGEER